MTNLKVYTETADDLIIMQKTQFNRLDKIRNKLNNICDELSLTHLKTEQPRQQITISPPVVVVATAKVRKNTAKVNLFNRLTTKVNVRVLNFFYEYYVHYSRNPLVKFG